MNRRKWMAGLGGVLLTGASILAIPSVIHLTVPFFSGEGSAFRYTGQEAGAGQIYVVVSVDIDDAMALEAYRQASAERARALIQQGKPQPVWVQVTFRRPVPIADVRALVNDTGFRVDSFLLAGRAPDGQKLTRIQVGALEDSAAQMNVPPPPPAAPVGGVEVTLAGVMLVQGEVDTTEQGLGRWLADERVYMVDTTSIEVHELIAQRHAAVVSGKEIVISVPSPFWNLDW